MRKMSRRLSFSRLCCLPLFRHLATQLDVGGRGRRFPLVHGDLARYLTLDDDGDGSTSQTAVAVAGRAGAGVDASASASTAFSAAPSPLSSSSPSFPVPAPVSKRARAAASVLRAMNEHPATTGGGDDNMFAAHSHSHSHSHSNTPAASVSTVLATGSDANDAGDPSEAIDDADADEDESSDGGVSSSSSSSSLSSSHVEHIYGCARTHELLIRIALDHDRSYPAAMRLLGRARAAGHRLRYRTAVNS
jgi:hypothetical protein